MKILGLETTCDETSVGIVQDGKKVLSNVVSTSADLHKKYGGIVPEVAAREQVKLMVPVIDESLRLARQKICEVDAISVAYGPGLIGSLLVGVEAAKTLAVILDKPLIAVNHLVGHVYANWLTVDSSQLMLMSKKSSVNRELKTVNLPEFPLVALIVSGGHTDLILMREFGDFKLLGSTRDDATGEVFDKVARVLGLGYPGGPAVEHLARQFTVHGSQSTVKLPRPMINDESFDFSFSGLKTAVVNLVNRSSSIVNRKQVAHEFQNAIVDVLVKKTFRAAKKHQVKSIVAGGGVAANSELRRRMSEAGQKLGVDVFFPSKGLSVDNGAMIAAAAFFEKNFVDPLKLQADPGLHF